MQVELLYFGVLKELFGGERDSVELPEGSDVAALLAQLRLRPDVVESGAVLLRSLAVAVNREYARVDTALTHGDEVALLPPVSGGCGALKKASGPRHAR